MSEPTFGDQYIEGDNTPVKKTNGKPKPVPRATLDGLMRSQMLKEAEASVALDKDETHVVGDPQVPLAGEQVTREELREVLSTEAEEAELIALTQEQVEPPADLGPEDEKIVNHALEILPHLGPEVTAAYLASAAGGQHAQHE